MGGRRRYDGTMIRDLPAFRKINPYVMRGRNESSVYYVQTIEIENTHEFIRRYNETRRGSDRLTLFHVLIAAGVRTIALRPKINRFVSGYRIYQRNRIQFAFIVKKDLTEEGTETNAKITFGPADTLESVRKRIEWHVEDARRRDGNESDHEIAFFTSLPRVLLRGVVGAWRVLDYFGVAPSKMIRLDPLYSSVYVANLGSVGLDAPYHHLYEWGNTSLFMVIGRPKRVMIDATGEPKLAIEIRYTVDDRITEGIYAAHSLQLFRDLAQEPEPLLRPPVLSEHQLAELRLVDDDPPLPGEASSGSEPVRAV